MLISIVLPCYRAENFITDIIEDVLKQTYPHWELLIISNGEKRDLQEEIIRKYTACYPNIRLFSESIGGLSRARNIGIKNCIGGGFYFLMQMIVYHLFIFLYCFQEAPLTLIL